ncbi:MAG: ADP-ribosylglycohydrolase family protein [Oscillospiraceae bacterium]
MYGAIFGDIIGSYYERHYTKNYDFEIFTPQSCFTDDTVMTAAVCDAIMYNSDETIFTDYRKRALEYAARYKQYYHRYPCSGFGKMFSEWAENDMIFRQKSYGNGAAMRVVPIGYAYNSIEEVLKQSTLSALYTHNNKEAINGAKAVPAAVYMARKGCSKTEIKVYTEKNFKYDLNMTVDKIRENYEFDSRTANSVPQAIICFLESNSYEETVRNAVSLGGDSDTLACISGGIAEAFGYEIPGYIRSRGMTLLDPGIKKVINEFSEKYCIR